MTIPAALIRRITAGAALLALCALLTGCSAAMALMALEKWFKTDSPTQYKVFLDGYELGAVPSATGIVTLRGATEGAHLLTVAKAPDLRKGVHATVQVPATRIVSLKDLNPFDGGVITGTVRRDSATGPLLGNVRVIAVLNAATLLAGGSGPIAIPQPGGTSLEYMMGYTDAAGRYKLGPAKYGDWLVVAAVAGFPADVQFTHLASGVDGIASLVLAPLDTANTGNVRGTVSAKTGLALASALLTAKLGSTFVPPIPAATRTRVATASGLSLPADDWFRWSTLTTLASAAGQYQLDLPLGAHSLEAYKFLYRATELPVDVTPGGAVALNFSLLPG